MTLEESWHQVLNEYYQKEYLNEGLSDTLNKTKKWAKDNMVPDGVKNFSANREYKEQEKKQGTGHGNSGSWGITAINGLGRLVSAMNGEKWTDYSGGVFDSNKRNHKDDVQNIKNSIEQLIIRLLTDMAIAYYIAQVYQPTTFNIRQEYDKDGNPIKGAEKSGLWQQSSETIDFESITTVIKNWFLKSNIFNVNGLNNAKGMKNYQWLAKETETLIRGAVIDKQQFSTIVKKFKDSLNKIDIKINEICRYNKITKLNSFKKNEHIKRFLNVKVETAQQYFNMVINNFKSAENYNLGIVNNSLKTKNLTQYLINFDVIMKQVGKLNKIAITKFQKEGQQPTPQQMTN